VGIKYTTEALARIERYQKRYNTTEKPSWALLQEILVASDFQKEVLPVDGTQLSRKEVQHLHLMCAMNNILPVVQTIERCNNSNKVSQKLSIAACGDTDSVVTIPHNTETNCM